MYILQFVWMSNGTAKAWTKDVFEAENLKKKKSPYPLWTLFTLTEFENKHLAIAQTVALVNTY